MCLWALNLTTLPTAAREQAAGKAVLTGGEGNNIGTKNKLIHKKEKKKKSGGWDKSIKINGADFKTVDVSGAL